VNISKMLSDLRAERSSLEAAIIALERFSNGQGKRRGRPPKWMSQARNGQQSLGQVTKKQRMAGIPKQMAAAQ
jgi:hypothetical protein